MIHNNCIRTSTCVIGLSGKTDIFTCINLVLLVYAHMSFFLAVGLGACRKLSHDVVVRWEHDIKHYLLRPGGLTLKTTVSCFRCHFHGLQPGFRIQISFRKQWKWWWDTFWVCLSISHGSDSSPVSPMHFHRKLGMIDTLHCKNDGCSLDI